MISANMSFMLPTSTSTGFLSLPSFRSTYADVVLLVQGLNRADVGLLGDEDVSLRAHPRTQTRFIKDMVMLND